MIKSFKQFALEKESKRYLHIINPQLRSTPLIVEDGTVHKRASNVSKDERQSLHRYTIASHNINNFLHKSYKGHVKKEKYAEQIGYIKNIDSAFSKKENHIGVDHEVYTGLPESPHVLFQRESERTGKPVHQIKHVYAVLPAYTSATTDKLVGQSFATRHTIPGAKVVKRKYVAHTETHTPQESHILHIKVAKDHPSISLKRFSEHKGEDEVLLHRGTVIKIHAKPKTEQVTELKDQAHFWHAETVGHTPKPID